MDVEHGKGVQGVVDKENWGTDVEDIVQKRKGVQDIVNKENWGTGVEDIVQEEEWCGGYCGEGKLSKGVEDIVQKRKGIEDIVQRESWVQLLCFLFRTNPYNLLCIVHRFLIKIIRPAVSCFLSPPNPRPREIEKETE
jgi:hypothetical protein